MSSVLTTVATYLILGTGLMHGTRTFTQLGIEADAFRASWTEEHSVRYCARRVAADRNLDAAADYLSLIRPQWTSRFAAAAFDLKYDLQPAAYAVPPPDAAGRCWSSGPQRLVASPHLEHHDGQAQPWPNWVMQWGEGEDEHD